LLREGAEPFVSEQDDGPRFDAFRNELDTRGVPYECGGHGDAAFDGALLVIPSPGVSPRIEPINRARAAGASVMGELEFAYSRCRSPILAVTGTNGKTTTTELLGTLLVSCGHRAAVAGNTHTPFSAAVLQDPPPEYIVLEVSSYQLETVHGFHPWIAAVLNVTPDHLARHGTLSEYAASKARLFACQGPEDIAVINYDDPHVRGMARQTDATVWHFSLDTKMEDGLWVDGADICHGADVIASVSDIALPGRHNLQNALAARAMTRAGGFDWQKTLAGLRSFKGVEHRIEHVARIDGADFYNDSKSTNIDSLKVALESFQVPVVLVAGGQGKGADYRVLRDLVGRTVKSVVTLGEDAPLIEAAFAGCVDSVRAVDMREAVSLAAAAAGPGDAVLLSPACASFDMFENFEHRGRVFKECVYNYRNRAETCSVKRQSS
jgi:UDP-N-acetylmuramoylalanine--D-glutamate ligase